MREVVSKLRGDDIAMPLLGARPSRPMPHSFAFQPQRGVEKIAGGERFLRAPGKIKRKEEPWRGDAKKTVALPGLLCIPHLPGVRFAHPRLFFRRPSGALHMGNICSELRFSKRLPDLSEKLCGISRPGRACVIGYKRGASGAFDGSA